MNTENSIMTSLPGRRNRRHCDPFYTAAAGTFKMRRAAARSAAWLAAVVVAGALAAAPAMPVLAGEKPAFAPDPLQLVSPNRPFRTLHTALDLDIDLEHQRIAGSVTHTIQSLRPLVAEIGFNCVGLTVDSVTVDGRRADFDYPVPGGRNTSWMNNTDEAVSDNLLVVRLRTPLARDQQAHIQVYYRGEPKIGLYWIPTEKGIPEKRWEVWSQGEGENNRYWIPCFDYPNDRSTFEGRFRVPRGYTAISNGALVEKRDVGDKTEFHWKLEQSQVSYLIMLAVAKYRVYEEKWNDVDLWYVVPPDADDATILRGYGLTGDMVDFFSKETGVDYPYAKYAQISVQNFIYGGMENTTATVMNMRTLYDEREALTRTERYLVAHELAHQWYGDMLTCREWSHMWLNEGFATYYAYLYEEHHAGDDAFRYKMLEAQRKVVSSDDADARPMVVDFYNRRDARNNTNVYNRGASVLHMMRFLLGDDMYRATIREYTSEHAFSLVETQDLMRAVRDVTGENLDWFFEQWVFLAGYPKFRVNKDWDRETHVLHMRVEQTQKVEGLVPVFRVPLDVEIAWDGGSRTQRIVVERASQDYYFSVPAEPKMVIFDKGGWIPKTLDFPRREEELLVVLEHGDFTARVDAALALGNKAADARTVPALRGVLVSDQYWGLRREAALALGTAGTPAARDALIEGLGLDEARVRLACAEALGGFHRDPAAAAALEGAINHDRAYTVRAQAVTSLVKTADDRASTVCIAALKQESDRSSVRNAAIEGLAELKDTAAMDRIRSYCTPGNRRDQRHPAIKAYASLAHELTRDTDRRRAAEFLAPFLDDWYLRTREAVIDALVTIGDPGSVAPLERVAASDPLAEVRDRARKGADRIRVGAAVTAGATTSAADVEELRRRIATLEDDLRAARKAAAGMPAAGATDD
jgi:aminopeptidase N